MLLSTLGSALFVVASLAIVAQGSAITLLVGAAGVITFTSFGLAWILLCLRAGPGLVVDDTGFDDQSSAVAVGRVMWSDVTSVSEWGAFGSSHVVVNVRNPEVYLARLGWFDPPGGCREPQVGRVAGHHRLQRAEDQLREPQHAAAPGVRAVPRKTPLTRELTPAVAMLRSTHRTLSEARVFPPPARRSDVSCLLCR